MIVKIREVKENLLKEMIKSGINPLLSRLYAARSVQSLKECEMNLTQLAHFSQFKNIDKVVDSIVNALIKSKKIIIVADYDADGATACTVGLKILKAMGGNVDFIVPDRFAEGYGLSRSLIDRACKKEAELILTVDNGIASVEAVHYAQSLGLEVIITDHHLPAEILPDCLIVNPNQKDCCFPSKSIAGVGVIYYVMIALRAKLREKSYFSTNIPEPNLAMYLDLVALGTVADVVQLDHNNRILVNHGLNNIRSGLMSPGLKALFQVAKRDYRKCKTFDLGFAIGPRINAAGRLKDMTVSIECLMSENEKEGYSYAEQLNKLNQDRRQIEVGMLEEALKQFEKIVPDDNVEQCYSIVAYHEHFHEGVIGIIAGRLKEQFHRPCIVFSLSSSNEIKGSARSISGLHIRDVLDYIDKKRPHLILRFGGHSMAAGLTLNKDHLEEFKELFEQTVKEFINPEDLFKQFITDGSLDVHELTLKQIKELDKIVWGQGFPEPKFFDVFEVVSQKFIGKDKSHSKLILSKDHARFEAMIFRCQDILPPKVKVVYRPVVNEWLNNEELQLYIDYWEEC